MGTDPVVAARVLSVLSVGAFSWALLAYAKAYEAPGARPLAGAAALFAVCCNAPFIIWSMGGLETVIYANLLAIVVLLIGRFEARKEAGARPSGLPLVELATIALFLTRSEGFAIAGAIVGWLAVTGQWRSGARIMAALILYLAFKYFYFGDILPSPYYAKADTFEPFKGMIRALKFAFMTSATLLLAGAMAHPLIVAVNLKKTPKHILLYAGVLGFTFVYPMTLGYRVVMDDAYRLYAHSVPLLSISVFHLANTCLPHMGKSLRGLAAVAIVGLPIGTHFELKSFREFDINWGIFPSYYSMNDIAGGLKTGPRAAADWLRENTCPDDVVVLHDAGIIPYFSERTIIDIWSLADPEIVQINYAASSGLITDEEAQDLFEAELAGRRYDVVLQDMGRMYGTPLMEGFERLDLEFVYLTPDAERARKSGYAYEVWVREGRSFPCR